MGWGEPSGSSLAVASDELADAVRTFIARPSTANQQRMESRLDVFDIARQWRGTEPRL